MWEYSKKEAVYTPGRKLSPDTESAGTLVLDFPATVTMSENKVCCFTYSIYGIFK